MISRVSNFDIVNFVDYSRKLVEVELKEKSLTEKSARDKIEFDSWKEKIENERKDLDAQRLTLKAKEEKFVKIKADHRSEIASLEKRHAEDLQRQRNES